MPKPTPIRPDPERAQFSLWRICLLMFAVAVIMATPMAVIVKAFFSVLAALIFLFVDTDYTTLEAVAHRFDAGDFAGALYECDRYIDRKPECTGGHTWKGYVLINLGELDLAEAALEYAISLEPQNGSAMVGKGIVELQRRQSDLALTSFNAATPLVVDEGQIAYYRGLANFHEGNIAQATLDADEAIESASFYLLGESLLGNILSVQGKHQEVINCYIRADAAGELDQLWSVVLPMRRLSEFGLGDYSNCFLRAQEDCDAVREPDDIYFGFRHSAYAWMLATCPESRFRNAELALLHAKKGVELSDDWSMVVSLAVANAEHGKFGEAIDCVVRALATCPPVYKSYLKSMLELFQTDQPFRDHGEPVYIEII